MPHRLCPSLALLALTAAAAAQTGTLDLLDGETLYDGGWLTTFSVDFERRATLRRGRDRAGGAAGAREEDVRTTLAVHHGLRHDLQVGALIGYEDRSRDGSGGPGVGSAGVGDVELFAKWRFYRWDAPHRALNVAALAGVIVPTGEDDAGSPRLVPELQVGRGSVDPAIGLAATYEPRRWRFNAAVLWQASLDTDGDDARPGESLVGELAVGNRFWLEPYPGPFMRFDAALRYRRTTRDALGAPLPDTGGEELALGLNLAFRPRPSLDFQLFYEVPLWQRVNGTQLARDFALGFAFGYRF